ncbi:GNAT family N-acetyltransferase [Psychroserpens sp. BH13MA-6]
MVKIVRTNFKNEDFKTLVRQLDAYLKITDGDEHDFYNQFNGIEVLDHVVVAYLNNEAVACGAFKKISDSTVEIKRMFTKSERRGQQFASKVLNTLEDLAKELQFKSCVLETGIRQKEAVAFYKKNGYQLIPNYGQYIGVDNSLCFEKEI